MPEKELLNVEFLVIDNKYEPFGARVTKTQNDGTIFQMDSDGDVFMVYSGNFHRDIAAKSERELKRKVKSAIKMRKRKLKNLRKEEAEDRAKKEKAEKARLKAQSGLLRFEEQSYEVEL